MATGPGVQVRRSWRRRWWGLLPFVVLPLIVWGGVVLVGRSHPETTATQYHLWNVRYDGALGDLADDLDAHASSSVVAGHCHHLADIVAAGTRLPPTGIAAADARWAAAMNVSQDEAALCVAAFTGTGATARQRFAADAKAALADFAAFDRTGAAAQVTNPSASS